MHCPKGHRCIRRSGCESRNGKYALKQKGLSSVQYAIKKDQESLIIISDSSGTNNSEAQFLPEKILRKELKKCSFNLRCNKENNFQNNLPATVAGIHQFKINCFPNNSALIYTRTNLRQLESCRKLRWRAWPASLLYNLWKKTLPVFPFLQSKCVKGLACPTGGVFGRRFTQVSVGSRQPCPACVPGCPNYSCHCWL